MADDTSAQQRVVRDYFRTTSGSSAIALSQKERRYGISGLRRRLRGLVEFREMDVLDLGSGTGELSQLALEQGAKSVVGVNLSQEEIDFACKFCNATFCCQDILEHLVAKAPASCDVICALNILEHLDKNTLASVLDQAHRVLRPSGYLVAMVPNGSSPFGSMTRYWDITHQLSFTPSSIKQLANLAGFSKVEFRECGPMPHGVLSLVRYVLWRSLRRLIWLYLMVEVASDRGGIYSADMLFRMKK